MNKKISIKNQFFFRSFIKTFSLLLLPLFIISTYSLYCFRKDTLRSIDSQNQNLMYQIKTQADSMYQTGDIISTFLKNSRSINDNLQDIFCNTIPSSNATKHGNALSQYLRSLLDTNPYAYSIYIYFDNDFGRYIVATSNYSYIHQYSDAEWLRNLLDAPDDFRVDTSRIPTYSNTPDKDVFAVYQKLYSSYSPMIARGILVTYFDTEIFLEYINALNLYPDQEILFIQEDRPPLFQTSREDRTDIWTQIAPHLNAESKYHSFYTEHNGCSYLTSLIPSSAEGLYYVSLIPRKNLYQTTNSMTIVFFLLAAAACVLSILLSLLSTRQEYRHIQTIIDIFDHANNATSNLPAAPANESNPYYSILHNIINLFLEQNYLKLQLENKQYQMQLLEIQALQHQINPHFLFNTLNTIYWEAFHFTNQPNTCSTMISVLSEIMSYSLTDIHSKVPIHRELEYLQHYIFIQQIRYSNKFELLLDIDEDLSNKLIIKMVLQPLVENAIYHGIKEKENHGIIKIKLYHRTDKIQVHILDNGQGIPHDKLASLQKQLETSSVINEHIGLLNTNRRLTLTYGESSAIRLLSRYGAGTIVSFSIPIETEPTV